MSDAVEPSQQAAEAIVAKYFSDVSQPTPEPPKEPAAKPAEPSPAAPEPAPPHQTAASSQNGEAPPAPSPNPAKESLAEVIRRAREERGEHTRREQEHANLTAEVKRLRSELEAAKTGHTDPASDPVGWARAMKMDKETQALVGQALLYDLVPDKAPPDIRVKLLEARIAREKAAEASRSEEERKAAETKAESERLNSYAAFMHQAVASLTPGSHPESEAWFGDDRATWARSLVQTANNLAEAARVTGRMADLSPGNIARVLEDEIGARMKARDARRASATKTTQPQGQSQQPGADKSAGTQNTTSTKGLGGGTPRPPAATDRERLERAIAAGFGPR